MNTTLLIVIAFLSLQISKLKKVLLQFSPIEKVNYVWLPAQSGQSTNGLSKSFAFLLILLFTVSFANAATYYSRQSGNWNANTTWSLTSNGAAVGAGVFPGSADDVVIERGFTVTVNISNATCASIQLGSTATNNTGTITFSTATVSNPSLTVTGIVQLGAAGHAARNGIITFISGSILTAGSVILGNAGATPAQGTITMSAGSTLNVGSLTVAAGSGTWIPSTGTVIMTSTNTLPATVFTSFNNLYISNGTTTTGRDLTVGGNLDVGSGTIFTTGNNSLGVTGTTGVTGTLTLGGTATKTFTGDVTINSGGAWNETAAAAITYNGNLQNDGVFTGNIGVHTFSSTGKTISGANVIAIPSLTINGTTTNNGTLTVSTALLGSSTLTNATTGILNIGGTSGITGLTATAVGNTVNYNGTSQTVKATNYRNLTLSGSGAKTFVSAVAVSGNLSISGTATATFNATGNTANLLTLGGIGQNSGTYGGTDAGATNLNSIYFDTPPATATGKFVTISCTAATAPSSVSSNSRCGAGTVSLAATTGSGQTIDWYAASSGGTALLTGNLSYTTPFIAVTTTYYAEVRTTATGCVSATRTAVTATVNAVPIVTVDKLTSNICSGQSVTLTATGDPGNALIMGNNSYMQVSNPNPLGTTKDFTFETMLYWTNNTTNWQRIFDFGANMSENMFFTPRYDGTILPRYAITKTGFCDTCEQRINGNTAIPTNSWHHLAITYDSGTNTGIMYLDGLNIGSNTNMTLTPADIAKTFSYFGKSQYPDPSLAGTMDEIRLWNVARTAAEINTYKASTVPLSSTGLVAYYKLNEGTGASSSSAVGSSSVTLSATPTPTWTTSTAVVPSSDGFTPTYSWAPTTGLNTPLVSQVIASPTTTTTYRVTSTYPNSCTAWVDAVVNVTAAPTAVAAGPDNVCQSATPSAITLSGSSVGGSATTGAWSITSGGGSLSSTAQTSSPGTVTYTPAANFTGTVSLLLTSNAGTGCTAVTSSRTITVNALPTVTSTTPASRAYTGVLNTTTVSAAVSGGVTIDWYANAAVGTALSTGSLNYAPIGINVGTYTVYAEARNTTTGCVSTSRTSAALTITQLPVILGGTRAYDGTTNALSTGGLTILNNADGGNLSLSGTGILAAKDVGTRAISAPAIPTRVQSVPGSTGGSANGSFQVNVATPANGNTLVAVISTRGNAANRVTSIAQPGVTNWTRATQATNTNGTTTEIWYASNVSGAGTAVTINQASSLFSAAVVMEYSGILTASPLDAISSINSTGNSTIPITGTTTTTTQANEVLIGGIGTASSSPTLGTITNSFTNVGSAQSGGTAANNAEVYALERIATATGTYSTGGTLNTSAQWSSTIATFKAVLPSGTALTLGGSASSNYTLVGLSGSMIITPKVLSVTAPTIASKVYDGTTTTGAVTVGTLSGFVVGETVTATATGLYADANAVSGKTATVNYTLADGTGGGLASNYSLAGTGTGNITPLGLTVTGATVTTKTYDGTTSATITGAGLSGVLAADAGNVTLANATAGTFNDANIGAGKAVATAPMTILGTASGNYTLTQPALTGTITGATPTVTPTVGTYTYNGTPNGPTAATNTGTGTSYTFSYAGTAYDTTTYSASATRPTKAGTYTVTVTVAANGNYASGTSAATAFTIDRAALTVSTPSVTTKTYDGTTSATITGAGLSGVLAADVANVTFGSATTGTFNDANVGAGKTVTTAMTISGTASSNYALTQPALTGTITGATPTVTPTVGTYTYNGTPNGPTAATNTGTGTSYTFSYAGTAYDTTTYSASATRPTKAGTYTVTVTVAANGNYASGTSAATSFTIDRAALTVSTPSVTTKTYDGTTSATITGAGLSGVLAADVANVTFGSATTGTFNDANVGVGKTVTTAMTISGTASSNYALTQPALTGTITGATPTVTPTVGTYTYNGTPNGPTVATNTGTGSGYTFSYAGTAYDATTYSASATRPTKAGTYTVTVTVVADGNYASGTSAATSFTIDRAALPAITVTGTTSFTYTGLSQGPATLSASGSTGTVTYSYSGTGATSYGPSSTPPINAGTYQVVASVAADANYNAASSAALAFTINKAVLTITATAQNKCYGTVLTLGSTAFTTSALQNGETITNVTLTSTGGNDASLTQSAGSYPGNIIPSTPTGGSFSASNYNITFVGGNLTINALPNNITDGFVATTMCSGGSPELTYNAENNSTFTSPYIITYSNGTNQYTKEITTASAFSFTPQGASLTANTPYTLISITNGNSCTRTAPFGDGTANLEVRPIPTATISGTTSVCAGASSPNITFANPQTVTIIVTYTVNLGANQTIEVSPSSTSSTPVSTVTSGPFVYDLVNVVYKSTPDCSNTITGQSATVTVNSLPAIAALGQPSDSTVCEEGDTSFSVTASGSGLTYQWEVSTDGGTNFSNLTNTSVYTNVTTATMNITAAATAMTNYKYRCVVSGTCTPAVTSNAAVLTVGADWGGISFNGGAHLTSNSTVYYCPSTIAEFSIVPISGVTQYSWNVPAGWVILSGDGTNTITAMTGPALANSGSVSVAPINNTFCPSYIKVTLSSVAPAALIIDSKIDPTCAIPTGTIKAVPSSETGTLSYTLIKTSSSPEEVVAKNGNGEFTGLSGGTYVVTYQINSGCYSDRSASVIIVPLVTNTWNGSVSGWSNGVPTTNHNVVFDADYSEPVSVNSCSCVIKPNAHVIIGSTLVLKIINGLNVDPAGSLTFNDKASLYQFEDNAVNSGSITYKRIAFGLKDLDYVYWSSPVATQKLVDLYDSDRYFKLTNGAWEAQGKNDLMEVGRGYIIRVRTASPPFNQNVEFKGEPNNGIKYVLSQGDKKSNLIGNPYPSAIDANKFILQNQPLSAGTLYFWTHFTARKVDVPNSLYIYSSDDYATYNISGGTATVPAKSTVGTGFEVTPSGKIASGQSFFVMSDTPDPSFKFNNSMRISASGENSQFFKQSNTKKTENIKKDRVWLNLTNDSGAFKQLLVGYITGATNDYDKLYDGVTRNGNSYIDFYSVNNSKNYTIQGRALPFDTRDEVPMGYKTIIEGTFKIGIDNVDGDLVNQTIYLEDKLTNTIHDLKSGPYSFTTAIGAFNDRFVLRYTNTSKLGTGDPVIKQKGFFVSVKNREIKINSFDQIINSVKVFDLKGSLLYERNKVNKNEFIIDTLNASSQFMIVMVQLEDGKWISEEIIFHD